MPNKHAAIKALRQTRKHAQKNNRIKTHIKALSSQLNTALKSGEGDTKALVQRLQQTLDKAAKTNVIHSNKAGRKVSSALRALAKQSK